MAADQPNNPYAVSLPPGTSATLKSIGRGGESYAAEIHGKYYAAAYYGKLFNFVSAAAKPLAVTSGVVSPFTLYNPPSTTVNLELVDCDVGSSTTAATVDTLGLYWQGPTLAALGTLGTIGVPGTNWFAANPTGGVGSGNPYTSFTHSGTPVRIDIVTTFGASSSLNDGSVHKDFDGKIILPPGHVVSALMSTTDFAGSTLALGLRWLESPIT